MILFQSASAQNFLSIGSSTVAFDLYSIDKTIIYGTNGTGKSTIIDIITYALFNKTIRDVKLPQLVNSVNKKNMVCSVEFSINSHSFKVSRGQKPTLFTIEKDGKLLDEDAATKDLQKRLEQEILGCDYRSFTQTSIMSSSGSKYFMELTTPERRSVVEQMLDIEVIGRMSSVIKDRQKEINARVESNINSINICEINITNKKENIDSISVISKDHLTSKEDELTDLITNLTVANTQLNELNSVVIKYPEKPTTPTKPEYVCSETPEKPVINTDVVLPDEPKYKISELPLEPAQGNTNLISELIEKRISIEQSMKSLINDANYHKKRAEFYKTHNSCDNCKQEISTDFKRSIFETINSDIKKSGNSYKELNNELDNVKYKIEEQNNIKSIHDQWGSDCYDIEATTLSFNTALKRDWELECNAIISANNNKNNKIISDWETVCNSLAANDKASHEQKVAEYEQKVWELMKPYKDECQRLDLEHTSQLRELNNKVSDLTTRQIKLEQDISELKSKQNNNLEKYTQELNVLNDEYSLLLVNRGNLREELETVKLGIEMLKDTGLKAKIVQQYLPNINISINDYLDKMGANYSYVLDENFNETIKSRHRDKFSYGSFSNGERSRINFAIMLMWIDLAKSKNTISSNLLLIDEVLDSALDEDGINKVMHIFDAMEMNIFVVSHRKEIRDLFDTKIEVTKNGNFSQYRTTE